MPTETIRNRRIPAAERQAQIVEMATRLFSQHGFGRVTMKMLAEACGVTEPALYRHFHSKDDVYEAVLTSLKDRLNIEPLLDRLRDSQDLEQILMDVSMYIVDTYGENTELSRLLLLAALEGHPLADRAFKDLRTPYVTFITRKLDELKESGLVREVHAEMTARCFIGMVMDCSLSTHLWGRMQGTSYDPHDVVRNNVPIYVQGLQPSGSA